MKSPFAFLLVAIALIAIAGAQTPAAQKPVEVEASKVASSPAAPPSGLTELELTQYQVLELRAQALERDKFDWGARACAKRGLAIEAGECSIDLGAKTPDGRPQPQVRRAEKPPEQPATPATKPSNPPQDKK